MRGKTFASQVVVSSEGIFQIFHLALCVERPQASTTHPGADLMQAGGDGFGRRVTAEHMTFQDPGVFVPRHICKIPEKRRTLSHSEGGRVFSNIIIIR